MPGPLSGYTIIEASAFIAAPYAGLTLAQMGAEVIRIDPVGGGLDYGRWPVTKEGTSLYWTGLNKGKKSVTLDIRDPRGREIAEALLVSGGEKGGIVLTNLPARGWLDFAKLREKRDDLIMVNIVGRRDGGVALDYTVNARTGFPMVTGPIDTERPVNHVMPVWDVVTALSAVNATLVAERHRQETGEGQYVRLALTDSAFSVLSHLGYVAEVEATDTDRPKTGNHVYGSFASDFGTNDDRRIMITAFTPRHWKALVEATGMGAVFAALADKHGVDFADETARFAHRLEIEAALTPWFLAHSLAEAGAKLDAVGACWGPYQTFRQAVEEDLELSLENPMFTEIDQPGVGRHRAAGAFVEFSAFERAPARPAPVLGADTATVLAKRLDMTSQEISDLQRAGIVG